FGHPENDPVTMVVALAAHHSSAHVQALAALARAIADPTRLAKILKATSALEVADLLDEGTAT
ncbi:MAG: PTS sugar transporter subunit IIA, partial [Candidatus Limnocylindrus sp.]